MLKVTFTKADGSRRVMKCTLRPDLLPERPITNQKEGAHRSPPADTVVAYDLDKRAFRSFNVNRVESIEHV